MSFTVTTPFYSQLAVPTSVRPAGFIPFWYHPQTYREKSSLGEGGERGLVASCEVSVAWADRPDFRKYAHGFTTIGSDGGGGGLGGYPLVRSLPLRCPQNAHLYLTDLAWAKQGAHQPLPNDAIWNPATDYNFAFRWVTYTATWESRSYEVVADADVPLADAGSPPARIRELCRYVTRYPLATVRERKISGFQLQTDGDNLPVAEPAFILDRGGTLRMIWWQVPVDYVPWVAIADCSGRVNDATFDPASFGNLRGVNLQADRVLFRGLAEAPVPYKGPDGSAYVDLHYDFQIRPAGSLTATDGSGATVPANPTWLQYAKVIAAGALKIYNVGWRNATGSGIARPIYDRCTMDRLFRAGA